jgi:hypothetical protein
VIRRIRKDESRQPARATAPVAPRDDAAVQPTLALPDSNSTTDAVQAAAP